MEKSQKITNISPEELLTTVSKMKEDRWRLIQISCTCKGDLEITYSFDRQYQTEHLRLQIALDVAIESIGGIYPFSYLYENEMKELFGVRINNLSIDFGGNLYQTAVKTPFQEKKADD